MWVKPAGDGAILSKMDSQAALRGADLFLFADGKIAMHIIDTWPDNALKVITKQPLPRDKWSHVVATYDGSRKAAGVAIYFNGKKQEVVAEVDQLTGTFATQQPFRIGRRSTDTPLHAALADVRLYHHALTAGEVDKVLHGFAASRAARHEARPIGRGAATAVRRVAACVLERSGRRESRRNQASAGEHAGGKDEVRRGDSHDDGHGRACRAARDLCAAARPIRSAG